MNKPLDIDASRCPLCGGDNRCARVRDPHTSQCWCMDRTFSDALLKQVPEAARHRACICSRCVDNASTPSNP